MKPDWENAPDWAQWVAMDADGTWWWFDEKPQEIGREWMAPVGGNVAKVIASSWRESLYGRTEVAA